MPDTLNREIVLCLTMQDRAHLRRNGPISFCGRVIVGPCDATSMRLCLRCLLESYRESSYRLEKQLANGEY